MRTASRENVRTGIRELPVAVHGKAREKGRVEIRSVDKAPVGSHRQAAGSRLTCRVGSGNHNRYIKGVQLVRGDRTRKLISATPGFGDEELAISSECETVR